VPRRRAIMQTLQKIIQNPRELHAWFPTELRTGYIFLPGVTEVGVGEELCVWIQFPAVRAEVFLTGLVAWRRLRQAPKMPAGSGLALRPAQVGELAFLGRMLTGDIRPLPERHHTRTRILSPWSCTVLVPHLGKWSPAALNEISIGGGRVELSEMSVHEGCMIQVNLPWHSESMHTMHLAWYRTSGGQVQLGMARELQGLGHEDEWDTLAEAASQYFSSQIISN